jgi:hypothetical protein
LGPQGKTLIAIKEDSLLPELFSEDSILRYEVLDSVLLATIDPTCQDQEQKLPRLKLRFHVPPDARVRSAASRIVSPLSSVENGDTGIHVKLCCHGYLWLGCKQQMSDASLVDVRARVRLHAGKMV